ncbi:MAG: cysteine--tRNA ligase [Proteobacteria bacterium]|nr:cysteine--tRNA ligase [Pseudomonadota bacterium]
MAELRLYNTLARRKQRFEPLEAGRAGIYTCGPTVYSHQHLGNLRTYVFADLLGRALRWFGFQVRHVINITDVGHLTDDADAGEDKMELAARGAGLSISEIADKWTRIFKQDLKKLRVLEPAVWCKATEHVPEQVRMIAELEEKGFTYRAEDGIYFDVSKDPNYGELARLDLETQRSQERIASAGAKRHPADFALWKFSPGEGPRRQMEWESPWGRGFPGWHIECSAMSTRYLGSSFDIHTGGIDHVPVHHTNEIAQSENALGVRPWVRVWMHAGWLMLDGGKLSKSAGGAPTLDDLIAAGIEPEAFRYFALGAHYRQQAHLTEDGLRRAQRSWRRLCRHLEVWGGARAVPGGAAAAPRSAEAELCRQRFAAALADDLNAPRALAAVWQTVRSDSLADAEKAALLTDFDQVLGLGLEAVVGIEPDESSSTGDSGPVIVFGAEVAPEQREGIRELIRERESARRGRDWQRADAIRDRLAEDGFALEDRSDQTVVRRAETGRA